MAILIGCSGIGDVSEESTPLPPNIMIFWSVHHAAKPIRTCSPSVLFGPSIKVVLGFSVVTSKLTCAPLVELRVQFFPFPSLGGINELGSKVPAKDTEDTKDIVVTPKIVNIIFFTKIIPQQVLGYSLLNGFLDFVKFLVSALKLLIFYINIYLSRGLFNF
jgi:hypothetical protein